MKQQRGWKCAARSRCMPTMRSGLRPTRSTRAHVITVLAVLTTPMMRASSREAWDGVPIDSRKAGR